MLIAITNRNGIQAQVVQRKIYTATHTHAAPWLVGTMFGYLLHLMRGRRFKLSLLATWAGWLLCLALLFTSIFALYPYSKLLGKSPSVLQGALYYTLVRIAWPLGLCWVVFACMQGYGSLANSFLSSPLWQPLSKLSYGAYIWHIFVVEVANRSVQTNTYFSNYQVVSVWQAGSLDIPIGLERFISNSIDAQLLVHLWLYPADVLRALRFN